MYIQAYQTAVYLFVFLVCIQYLDAQCHLGLKRRGQEVVVFRQTAAHF